jgi:hypothetical protein
MRRLNPTVVALIVGVLALLLLVYVFAGGKSENRDKLSDDQVAGRDVGDPEKLCGSQATYDLIKRELFRLAARVRSSDQAAFDKLAAYSVIRMDAPMLRSHDEDVGTVRCAGSLALDLPPGVAVVGGRRTLTADVEYALQPAADGSGNVLTLTNADAIITPLATLARTDAPAEDPLAAGNQIGPDVPPVAADPGAPAQIGPEPPAAAPPSRPTASPSFNCANARTRGEIAVCNNPGLAGLDRQMAAQFNRAMSEADAGERALLQRTRARFLGYRDSCRSESCMADAYRGRIAEIRDIMAGRWRSP